MDFAKTVKWTVMAFVGGGLAISLAKHGTDIGNLMKASADTIVSLGKGAAAIG